LGGPLYLKGALQMSTLHSDTAREILALLSERHQGNPAEMSTTMSLAQAVLFMHTVLDYGNPTPLDTWADSLALMGRMQYKILQEKNLQ